MNFLPTDKKGQLSGITSFVIVLVITAFVIAIGLTMLASLESNLTETNGTCYSEACTSVQTITTAMGTIPDWFGIIVLAVIAVIVLGVVMLLKGASQNN